MLKLRRMATYAMQGAAGYTEEQNEDNYLQRHKMRSEALKSRWRLTCAMLNGVSIVLIADLKPVNMFKDCSWLR